MSYILYRGPSLLDGDPIVVIATGVDSPSTNRKTGPMVQTYILRDDMKPQAAIKAGLDKSVCGDCKHRNGTCYVLAFQGPTAVYNSFRRDAGKRIMTRSEIRALGTGRNVRIGAYGDPAAAPVEVWQDLVSKARMHTGYTHGWHYCDQRLKELCMASVDSYEEFFKAQSMGWRTFRVMSDELLRTKREVLCPASEEAGTPDIDCIKCGACNGNSTNRRGSIAIRVHGSKSKINHFNTKHPTANNPGKIKETSEIRPQVVFTGASGSAREICTD